MKGGAAMPLVECKLCRANLLRNPPRGASAANVREAYAHPVSDFPRAYGTNVDSGNDVRADNCGTYGVNTGAKLAEYHMPWGWIDELTGARLCGNEDSERRSGCCRERFHEDEHKDAVGHAWCQRNHFLLSRVEVDGVITHLDLCGTQMDAQSAAWHDLGARDDLEWIAQERSFQYHGRLPDRVAYIVTYIDVQHVGEGMAAASKPLDPAGRPTEMGVALDHLRRSGSLGDALNQLGH